MRWFVTLVIIVWVALAAAAYCFPAIPAALWTACVGASVTLAIAFANWWQGKRQAVLELHREYYSRSFSEDRQTAARFFKRYGGADWSQIGPYALPDPDQTREGYSQVLRFWHRVAVLYQSDALDRMLAQRLLAREIGYWFGFVFEGMEAREDMFTRDLLFAFIGKMRNGRGKAEFENGAADGRRNRAKEPLVKWVRGPKRWTTKGRNARQGS